MENNVLLTPHVRKASILVWPDDTLKQISQPINGVVDERVQHLVKTMISTLVAAQNGVGLSAIQIGVPLRVFIIKTMKGFMVVADPSYVGVPDTLEKEKMEGCLSFPGNIYIKADRFGKIQAKYTKIDPALFKVTQVEKIGRAHV